MDTRTYIIMDRILKRYPAFKTENFKYRCYRVWTGYRGYSKTSTRLIYELEHEFLANDIKDDTHYIYINVLLNGKIPDFVLSKQLLSWTPKHTS